MMRRLFFLLLIMGTQLHALSPKKRIGIYPWGTHFPALLTVAVHTQGPILELGAGDYSTPMLHALCGTTQRLLVSAETSKRWLSYFKDLERAWHRFIYVPVYADDESADPHPEMWDAVGNDMHWSIVFIDHGPIDRRKVDIARLRKNTDIFVVHDTEERFWGFHDILASFKYHYIYDRYHVTTTIVSDTIDVKKFFDT